MKPQRRFSLLTAAAWAVGSQGETSPVYGRMMLWSCRDATSAALSGAGADGEDGPGGADRRLPVGPLLCTAKLHKHPKLIALPY